MNEILKEKIKNLPEIDFSNRRHKKIMWQARFLRRQGAILFVTALLFLNLIISGAHVWFKIAENDVITGVVNLWAGFEMTLDFVSDLTGLVFSAIPLWRVINIFFDISIITATAILYSYLNSGLKIYTKNK